MSKVRKESYFLEAKGDLRRAIEQISKHLTKNLDIKSWELILRPKPSGRSLAQNALSAVWYREIAEQNNDSELDVRRHCKLQFGIPILEKSERDFIDRWNEMSKNMSYMAQHYAMDYIKVTSIFTVEEKSQFLQDIEHYYGPHGVSLSKPEDQYYAAMGYTKKQPETKT